MEFKEKCEWIIDQFNGKIFLGNNLFKDGCWSVLIRLICVFVFYKYCIVSMQFFQIFLIEFLFKIVKIFFYEN